jgi:hypothetical protein
VVEAERRLEVVRPSAPHGDALRALGHRLVLFGRQPEHGLRRPAHVEAPVLEEHPAGDVSRPDGADHGAAPMLDRDRHGRVEELAPQLLAAVARGDHRAEQVGVRKALGNLDAAEADHEAVLVVDEQRRLGRLVPVGELALELVQRGPQRIADLLLRPAERTTREVEDGRDVVPAKATQAVGHERIGRARDRRRTWRQNTPT